LRRPEAADGTWDAAAWVAAGFRWSTSGDLARSEAGRWEAAVVNDEGTAVVVRVVETPAPGNGRVVREQRCRFRRADGDFEATREPRSPAEALAWAADVWRRLGCSLASVVHRHVPPPRDLGLRVHGGRPLDDGGG
jgi:hypothetical protein